jgi:hypothetical protein
LIVMKSFEFIFILYLMHKIIGIADLLCWALQQKSLDILNAIKTLLLTWQIYIFKWMINLKNNLCLFIS